jgi:hypothetical protein
MRATSWKVLGCASLLTLNLGLMQSMAYADDVVSGDTTDETTVDSQVDEPVGDGTDIEPIDNVADAEPDYDPQIAQSGIPSIQPNERSNNAGLNDANSTFNRSNGNEMKWNGKGPKPSLFGTNSPLRDWFKNLAAK